MQVIPASNNLSDILGKGLEEVATNWAQHKTTTNALKGLGFSDTQARAYSHLGPQAQLQAIQAQQQQQAQEASNSAISKILGTGLPPAQTAQFQVPQQQAQAQQMQPQRQQEAIQQATSIAQNPAFRKLNEQQQQSQALQNQQLMRQPSTSQSQPITGEQAAILQAQQQQNAPRPSNYEDKISQINRQRQALGAIPLSPGDRFRAEALLNSAEDRALKEEQHRERVGERTEGAKAKAYQYNKETISKTREAASRAKQDNEVLESLIKANESGKLYQGPTRKLLEKAGLEDVITNTPTQFAAKQLERFVTGAPAKFGTGRFTNFLAESYQKGLPRLVNTKQAFDLIAKNIILENKAVEAQYKAMRDIIKESESKGKAIPYDLQDQAIERAQPQLDKYVQQSIKNLESALGEGSKTSFESLPTAKDYAGKTITDTKTGTKYKSNGTKWVKA